MRQALVPLMLIALACSSPEAPREVPAKSSAEPLQAPASPAPPPPPRFWSAGVRTFGGFSGVGKGSISVNSDGEVGSIPKCGGAINPPGQRSAVERAVALALPAQWQQSYRRAQPSGLTDQFSYQVSLEIETDGRRTRYTAGWRDDSFGLLPPDLRALDAALWALRGERVRECPQSALKER